MQGAVVTHNTKKQTVSVTSRILTIRFKLLLPIAVWDEMYASAQDIGYILPFPTDDRILSIDYMGTTKQKKYIKSVSELSPTRVNLLEYLKYSYNQDPVEFSQNLFDSFVIPAIDKINANKKPSGRTSKKIPENTKLVCKWLFAIFQYWQQVPSHQHPAELREYQLHTCNNTDMITLLTIETVSKLFSINLMDIELSTFKREYLYDVPGQLQRIRRHVEKRKATPAYISRLIPVNKNLQKS